MSNTVTEEQEISRFKQIIEYGSKVIQYLIIPIGVLAIYWVQTEIKTYGDSHFATKHSLEVVQKKIEHAPLVTVEQLNKLVDRVNANDHLTAVALANLQAEMRSLNAYIKDLRDDLREMRKK